MQHITLKQMQDCFENLRRLVLATRRKNWICEFQTPSSDCRRASPTLYATTEHFPLILFYSLTQPNPNPSPNNPNSLLDKNILDRVGGRTKLLKHNTKKLMYSSDGITSFGFWKENVDLAGPIANISNFSYLFMVKGGMSLISSTMNVYHFFDFTRKWINTVVWLNIL